MAKNEFGLHIKALRERAGLSQRKLAEEVGTHFSYLSKIENGLISPPSREVLLKLAEVLKADKDDLVILAGKIPSDIASILEDQKVMESLRNASDEQRPWNVNNSSFSERLRTLRERAGLSQAELATIIGVNFTYLSKIENGVKPPPSGKVISKLAN
ncbi:MAG: helix-turn-helix transcriptional regulator, partial [Dehalococcoidales bacterium]|nr:helix-turn-helix transcriptional regulator [Dehalococcoidales bacterium]